MLSNFQFISKDGCDYSEDLKKNNLTHDVVLSFRQALTSSEYVPRYIHDKQLLPFIRDDLQWSIQRINAYYKCKQNTPELFHNRDVASGEIQQCLDNLYFVHLPPTPDNRMLILHKLKNFEPSNYNFEPACKTFMMTAETYIHRNGYKPGSIMLFDLEGVQLGHLLRPTFRLLYKGMKFVQDAAPLNILAIHILNSSSIADKLLAMMRPFVRSELLNKVRFHTANMDFEKFYEECVPKCCLPSDYGGDLASVAELHEETRRDFMNMRDYFLMEEQQKDKKFDHLMDDDDFMEPFMMNPPNKEES